MISFFNSPYIISKQIQTICRNMRIEGMIGFDYYRRIVFYFWNVVVKLFRIAIGKESDKFEKLYLIRKISFGSIIINLDCLLQQLHKPFQAFYCNKLVMSEFFSNILVYFHKGHFD